MRRAGFTRPSEAIGRRYEFSSIERRIAESLSFQMMPGNERTSLTSNDVPEIIWKGNEN